MIPFLSQIRRAVQSQNSHMRSRTSKSRKNLFELENLEPRIVLSAITGTIYDDVDSSGTKTGGDNTLGGWQVFLDLDGSGTLNNQADGSPEPSAFAGTGGDFTINMNAMPTGLYRVTEIVQPGWTPTAPATQDVSFTAGRDYDKIDFFNFAGGSIVGTVWEDLNQDGIRATDPVTDAIASSGFEITTVATGAQPADVGVISGFRGPRLVSINAGDQSVSVHAGQNNDRFFLLSWICILANPFRVLDRTFPVRWKFKFRELVCKFRGVCVDRDK